MPADAGDAAAVAKSCNRLLSCLRCSRGIFCDTPMCLSCGKNTSNRPDRLICVDSRAPFVPIGSLMTCTSSVCPSKTCFSIGGSCKGTSDLVFAFSLASGSVWRKLILLTKSATCKNAARSSPISMNADCMPGNTRATLPK